MQTRQSIPANLLHVGVQLPIFPLQQSLNVQGDQPTANCPQEDHVPFRQQHLLRREIEHLRPVPGHIEHAPVARDDGHEEEHAGQVAQIRDRPVEQQIHQADPPMQERRPHEHHIRREQIRPREHDHRQADREEERADGPDQARRVLLVPGRGRGGEQQGAAEAEQGPRHAGVEPELVEAHVGLLGADARDQLGRLLRREGVHCVGCGISCWLMMMMMKR